MEEGPDARHADDHRLLPYGLRPGCPDLRGIRAGDRARRAKGEGPPGSGVRAVMPPATKGIVYLVGAGPGDPGLITVRGHDLLSDCDAIVYDALANPILLEEARRRGGVELI